MAVYDFEKAKSDVIKMAADEKPGEPKTIMVKSLGNIMLTMGKNNGIDSRGIQLLNPKETVIVKPGDRVMLTDGHNYADCVVDGSLFLKMKDYGRAYIDVLQRRKEK